MQDADCWGWENKQGEANDSPALCWEWVSSCCVVRRNLGAPCSLWFKEVALGVWGSWRDLSWQDRVLAKRDLDTDLQRGLLKSPSDYWSICLFITYELFWASNRDLTSAAWKVFCFLGFFFSYNNKSEVGSCWCWISGSRIPGQSLCSSFGHSL